VAVTGTARLVLLRARELAATAVVASRGIDRSAVRNACARVLRARALVWSERTVLWPKALTVYLPQSYLARMPADDQRHIEGELAGELAECCRIGEAAPQVVVRLAGDPALSRGLRVWAHSEVPDRAEVERGRSPAAPDPLEEFGRRAAAEAGPTLRLPADEQPDADLPAPQPPNPSGQTEPAPPPAAVAVWRDDGRRMPVEEAGMAGVLVGRDADGAGRVHDERASARHCRFLADGGDRVWVEDLGSRNGTWVSGARTDGARELVHGDDVRVAGVRFVVSGAPPADDGGAGNHAPPAAG
jgi:hypothetical protein